MLYSIDFTVVQSAQFMQVTFALLIFANDSNRIFSELFGYHFILICVFVHTWTFWCGVYDRVQIGCRELRL